MSRSQLITIALVALGLFFLMIGGIVVNLGHTQISNPTQDQINGNANLANVVGPSIMDFGLFMLVSGLVFGAAALQDLDLFVRLFLLILAFVALLLVLASPTSFFA